MFGIYPHGFPLASTPADGVRGFGWPTLAAWIVIWAAAWLPRPRPHRPASASLNRSQPHCHAVFLADPGTAIAVTGKGGHLRP